MGERRRFSFLKQEGGTWHILKPLLLHLLKPSKCVIPSLLKQQPNCYGFFVGVKLSYYKHYSIRRPNQLSVAFAKEESAEAASETILPARPVSDRINLVTDTGLAMLHEELATAQRALEAANLLEDINERRRQSAAPLRDLRYYTERVRTAQLMSPPVSNEMVAFGHTVTFEREDGRKQTFRIVGEDEANPSQASISHGSPVAVAIIGKTVGDVVQLGQFELEIMSIS